MKSSTLILPRAIIALSLTLSVSLISSQTLAVECGDTIIKPTILTQDLNCELTEENPVALTVMGPFGSLTIEDAEILCSIQAPLVGETFGVVLKGINASVSGGKISNCENGVSAEGQGSHSISSIEIVNFNRDGIRLASNRNTVSNVMLTGLAGSGLADGISVQGNNNSISNCIVGGNGDEGIEILGDYTNVTFCQISGYEEEGIEVNGDYSNITQNIIQNNIDRGVTINGNFTTVGQNIIRFNGEIGVDIRNTLGSRITSNTILENGSQLSVEFGGIVITGDEAAGNQIIGNTVFNNEQFDLSDPFDPDCTGSNIWEGNQFGSANPGCLN
ncbi:right-handed parallel beta-helix repeat-containing protein [Microbulbifer variabilis]|uniref:right-handed parallel beta-helix repeat-containing protein n=1 Tax=Microbulbifer variabilis TaxID=266805 RepID=UPI0003A8B8DB|nr:right-handed parallel beta-helix repeat-containing protein [Microbulbifer variabilis]